MIKQYFMVGYFNVSPFSYSPVSLSQQKWHNLFIVSKPVRIDAPFVTYTVTLQGQQMLMSIVYLGVGCYCNQSQNKH
jgi:hypothetical protein